MKKALYGTTALALVAVGSAASAQEIDLFGDARLGLGWQTSNDGDLVLDDDDELRAISRVRFGVNMTGTTNSGITFGATIRADNAIAGEGNKDADDEFDPFGVDNQTAGSVFVSGAYGTLTYGDTDEAHQFRTGDLPELGLTGLGFFNELPYFGNRLGIPPGTRDIDHRPTVRYDYELAGFGLSVSTGSELESVAIGASYGLEFGGGSVTLGAGYFDGSAGDVIDVVTGDEEQLDASQWVVGVRGEFAGFEGVVNYIDSDLDGEGDLDDAQTLGIGVGTEFASVGLEAFYRRDMNGDDDDSYGLGAEYDLGGGASVKTGVVRTFEVADEDGDTDQEWMADFGISMSF